MNIKKNQQKTNSFHPTHFPHFTKNGMSLVKISLLIGIGIGYVLEKEEKGETLIEVSKTRTFFPF